MRTALIAAIVTQIALITAVLLLRPPPTIIEAQTTIPVSFSVPITVQRSDPGPIAPPPSAAKVSCPAPRTDAPRAKDVHPPQDVNRVVASRTNAGWIAAWDEHKVLVSTDAGKTFMQMLDGPGEVDDVTFDCFGRAIVLRGKKWLGIRDGAREAWREVPGLAADDNNTRALLGGGPDALVVGISDAGHGVRLAATSDLGASWWFRDVADYAEIDRTIGYQAADGSIQLMLTAPDCDSEPSYWLRVHDGKVDEQYIGYVGDAVLDGDRLYAERNDELRYRRFGDEEWHATKSKRAAKQLAGSMDPAGRVWTIDETKDGEAAWAVVRD